MTNTAIHVEGALCVKKVQTYIDALQICPADMREEYAFKIVNDIVGQAFVYWWTKERDDSFADMLVDYAKVYCWVREDMVRQGCKYCPEAGAYMQFMHFIGRVLVNL